MQQYTQQQHTQLIFQNQHQPICYNLDFKINTASVVSHTATTLKIHRINGDLMVKIKP
jgi:hypothetical protein